MKELPENWFCRARNIGENIVLTKWMNKVFNKGVDGDCFNGFDYYCSDGEYSLSNTSRSLNFPENYDEISFDDFKRFVLNESIKTKKKTTSFLTNLLKRLNIK